MSSLAVRNVLDPKTTTVGASETNYVVTNSFPISDRDSECITVDILYQTAVAATGITAKLQSTSDESYGLWIDHGTVAITTATATKTRKTIDLDMKIAGDQSSLPLRPRARIVISTGAGDSLTIDKILVSRRVGG